MANQSIDLYRIAVMSINEVARSPRPPDAIRVDLEALKAMIDVLIGKLPKEESDGTDSQP